MTNTEAYNVVRNFIINFGVGNANPFSVDAMNALNRMSEAIGYLEGRHIKALDTLSNYETACRDAGNRIIELEAENAKLNRTLEASVSSVAELILKVAEIITILQKQKVEIDSLEAENKKLKAVANQVHMGDV